MIIVKDKGEGTEMTLNGSTTELLSELTLIINQMRKMLTSNFGEETADRMIAECGRIAYLSDEEAHAEAEQARKNRTKLMELLEALKGEME